MPAHSEGAIEQFNQERAKGMNFKYKVLGFVAAIGMAIGIAGPAMATTYEGSSDTDNTVTVTLTEGGDFQVHIASNLNLGSLSTSAASLEKQVTGRITINYTDTLSYRDFSFLTKLQASDFGADSFDIPAANFTILKNYNPIQGRWASGHNAQEQQWGDIGDIGATGYGAYASPGCGETVNQGTGFVSGPGGVGYQDWTVAPGAPNDLSTLQTVACGQAGPGTAGQTWVYDSGASTWNALPYVNGSIQYLDVQLTIPAAQPAGSYVSELTLDIVDNGSL
jgi:hypothetical protein